MQLVKLIIPASPSSCKNVWFDSNFYTSITTHRRVIISFVLIITKQYLIWYCNYTRGCSHFEKCVLNLFVWIKLKFFITIFHSLSDIFSGWKPASGNHEPNLKKVSAIPCGCNTKWTKYLICSPILNILKKDSNYFSLKTLKGYLQKNIFEYTKHKQKNQMIIYICTSEILKTRV